MTHLHDAQTPRCDAVERELEPRVLAVHDGREARDRKAAADVEADEVGLGEEHDARHVGLRGRDVD